MGESVVKDADKEKEFSPTNTVIHHVRDEPEMQPGSLGGVIGNIRRDGGKPSVESIATELGSRSAAERTPALLALQQTHGNRYVQRVVSGIQARQTSMQRNVQRSCSDDPEQIKRAAVEGVSGSGGKLPYLEKIQTSFGAHDVTDVQAHVGGAAGKASDAIGAKAYTMGDHVAFKEVPDLRTAAHEAAHAVQQRSGMQLQKGVGQIGDVYERHADEVADRVVQRRSAEDLLARATGTALRQVVQMSYDEFMRLPIPRGNLFQEIGDLNLADVNTILGQMGTPQQPGDLWQRIELRYVSGTAQLAYARLIERRNQLQSREQGELVEQTTEAGTEETASVEEETERGGVREDVTRVYRDVPCTNWNMLLEAIRETIALRVMSRTLGPGGQPVRREVRLTENNESLVRTYEAIEAAHREEIDQGWDVEDITAVFHYVNDRVERITFRPPQREGEGERGPGRRTLTVEFGVGGLTSQQLTSQDPEVSRDVFLRFERQLVLHVAMMDSINVSDDFYDQIDRHMSELSAPDDVPLVVQTTVQVTPRGPSEHWPCRVTGMTPQVSTFVGNEPPQVGPDPEQARRERAGEEAWENAWQSLIVDVGPEVFGLAPIGAIISAGQQTWALIQFNMEYLYYAYRVGWWHAINTPQYRRDPERAFMSSSDASLPEGHGRRVGISEHYNHGYNNGDSTRPRLYEESWRNIYNHRQERGEQQRALIEHLDRQENRRSRDEFIAGCLNHQYRNDSDRRVLIDSARGQ